MLKTFNLGIGLILVVERKNEEVVMSKIEEIFKTKFSKEMFATYPQSRWTQGVLPRRNCWKIGSLVEKNGKLKFLYQF